MAHTSTTITPTEADISHYHWLNKTFIVLLITASLTINILAPILAWQWLQLPFLGVLTEHTLVVAPVFNPNWPAHSALAEDINILQAVNDRPVTDSQSFVNAVAQLVPGDPVTLTFFRPGPATEYRITTDVILFAWPDFLLIFGLPYLIGLAYLATGLFVYRLQASERVGEVFAVYCLLFSLFTGTFFSVYTFHHFTSLWTVVLPFIGASLIHLALLFPLEAKITKRRPLVRLAPYIPAFLLSLYGLFGLYSADPTGYFLPWRLSFAFIGFSILATFAILLQTWYRNFSPLVRQQTQIIFLGGVVAFLPALSWTFASGWLGITIPFRLSTYTIIFGFTVFFPLAIAYAILRYQFLQLDVMVKRVIVYFGLISIVVAVYFVIAMILMLFFNVPSPISNPIVLAAYGLLVISLLEPLQNWLRRLVGKASSTSIQNYQEILQNYASRLATLPLDVDGILAWYLDQIQSGVETNGLYVFFIDNKETQYIVRARATVEEFDAVQISYMVKDELPLWLGAKREPLRLNAEGNTVSKVAIDQEEIARLAMLNVRAIVPLIGSERLLGWLALGDKAKGKPYNKSDLAFLANISNQTVIALENAQLFETAQRKTAELLALQETNLDIASEQETERILTSVLERAANLLNAMGGSIFLIDPNHSLLNNEICYNLDSDYASISLRLGEGIAGRVAEAGEPRIIKNYQGVSDQVAIYKGDDFGSVVAAPFAWQGKVKGILELIRAQNAPVFGEDDIELLSILANQAAIALENARLLQEAQNKAAQLGMLNEVNRIISATLDREAALKLITEVAVNMLETEAGSIFVVDEAAQALIFEVAQGPAGTELMGAKVAIDTNSIVGSIAISQEAMIVNDVASDPHWDTSFDKASDFTTRDILGAPMIAFGKVVGVIEVINKKSGSGFTEEELATLVVFARQAAIAIVNAERFTQTDQALASRVQELNTLQMIDRELNATLDFDAVLDLTLSRIMDALGSSVGLIGVLDEEKTGLYFQSMVGIANEYNAYRHDPWFIGRGVIGQVAETGQPLYLTNGDLDRFASDGRSTCQLCTPIILDDSVMGVISLELSDEDPFTEQDQEFAVRVASHAALAIKNAHLFNQVKSANQAKTEFMSVASHELKIPMTSIKGYAKLLQMIGGDSLTQQQDDFIEIIMSNIDRMDRLVSDLLDVSRIEAGRLQLELSDVSVREVVEEVVQSVETQIQEKELKLEIDIPPTLPQIRADHGRLVQVMTNLISNAYKYTPGGGNIAVKARHSNGSDTNHHLRICVSDTGLGIADDEQQQLFSKFFRASDPRAREEPGTGLGLAITKSLIEMHGGTMWFESVLGEGSTFGFDLPMPENTEQEST